jgi:hypothetical protein
MTGSKKSEQKPGSADALTQTSPEASVELSETQLADASGGIIAIAPQLGSYKFNSAQKVNTDPALLLPAVKPGQ